MAYNKSTFMDQKICISVLCKIRLREFQVMILVYISYVALDAYCKQEDSCVSMVNCLKLDIPPHIPSTVINEEQLVAIML